MIYQVKVFGSDIYKKEIISALLKTKWATITNKDKFDIGIVADYGHIFTKEELNKPKFGYYNFHPSDLPKYRGATPLQTMIIDGVKKSKVTLIKMDEKIDNGLIISQKDFSITSSDTTKSLKEKTAKITSLMVNDIFDYIEKKINAQKQNINNATYTHKIDKNYCEIKLSDTIQIADRKIRACYPNPKAFLVVNGIRLIIHDSKLENSKLKLLIVQKEGKKPINYSQYLLGEKNKELLDKLNKFCYTKEVKD